ncbi:methyltransferase [Pseudidiomarina sp. PP-1MA]|uniref:Methyltransferase n=1 Tax=Pseudidiomarina sp. PP-1MA TaxID=3237706 RepID=A0AB39X4H4_9GAMM
MQLNDFYQVLQEYREFWQFKPFAYQQWPWQHTDLTASLARLQLPEIELIDSDKERQRQFFSPYFPAVFSLPELSQIPAPVETPPLPFWLTNGIGGRKLAQIEAFISHLPQSQLPLLEWCAGKGHLGRLASFVQQRQVVSAEWQQNLCEQGQKLAQQWQLPQQFVPIDVLSAAAAQLLQPNQHAVALHACGQLHLSLLQQAVARETEFISLAPCCYHLIHDSHYQPLSTQAQKQNLHLAKFDLQLAVQGQVTAGQRITQLRHTEMQWRMAYHALYQDLQQQVNYRPLASVGKHWFSGEFADFAQWAAAQHQWQLPAKVDWPFYLDRGRQLALHVARLDLVRHVFRRPLELWLLLDRLEFLREHGYQAELSAFCDYQTTPRNGLITAQKIAAS